MEQKKTNPCFRYESKTREVRNVGIFEDSPMNNVLMESSRRDLFTDIAVDSFIPKNNQITFSPSFTCIPKTGVGLPKKRLSFCCVQIIPIYFRLEVKSLKKHFFILNTAMNNHII